MHSTFLSIFSLPVTIPWLALAPKRGSRGPAWRGGACLRAFCCWWRCRLAARDRGVGSHFTDPGREYSLARRWDQPRVCTCHSSIWEWAISYTRKAYQDADLCLPQWAKCGSPRLLRNQSRTARKRPFGFWDSKYALHSKKRPKWCPTFLVWNRAWYRLYGLNQSNQDIFETHQS